MDNDMLSIIREEMVDEKHSMHMRNPRKYLEQNSIVRLMIFLTIRTNSFRYKQK
jgi:hypothetical protein